MASLYEIPISKLYGIGEKRARLFNKLGIASVGDLIRFYPRTYEDWSHPCDIIDAEIGQVVCVRGALDAPVVTRRIGGGRLLSSANISDGTAYLKLTFFNNRFVDSLLRQDEDYLFYGKLTLSAGVREMVSPTFQPQGKAVPIHPIYPQVAGLSTKNIESAVRQALTMLPETVKDPISAQLRERYSLIGLREALTTIHFPASQDEITAARRRLIFEEMLVLVLGLSSIKKLPETAAGAAIEKDFTGEFMTLLPFELTNAQRRAIEDCIHDMVGASTAMNRLVQGDVGSGKTMVAAAAAYTCAKNGYQTAMMAPTEILARQHFENLQALFENTGVSVCLLTGSMKAKEKREALAAAEDGSADIVIGTHSLISDSVVFSRLGLVITDEQHRFGVRQRATLLAKGESPHLLVMSATPIPRTLALMIYGDLDISIINELPPGRQKVDTFFIDSTKRQRVYSFLKKHIAEGRQCYIVCPAVESTEGGLVGAQEYAAQIAQREFADVRVGLLHGQMKSAEKDDVMMAFVSGDIDVLVATTVIEVGVDVPNAAIMLVENAERFGLSQLHQLRGRVGRGQHKSYCILLSDAKGDDAKQRMKTLCATNDGFRVADEDLKLRGPGDFFGSRQHGLPELKMADLAENVDILHEAQQAAALIMDNYLDKNDSSCKGLRAEVRMLFNSVGSQLN